MILQKIHTSELISIWDTISLSFQGPTRKGSASVSRILVVLSSTVWLWLLHLTRRRKSDGKAVEVRPSIASIVQGVQDSLRVCCRELWVETTLALTHSVNLNKRQSRDIETPRRNSPAWAWVRGSESQSYPQGDHRHSGIPLFFLITSWPEQDIRQACNEDPLNFNALTRRSFFLDNNYEPDEDDIRSFLQSKLDDIKIYHPSKYFLPASCPSDSNVECSSLVQKKSSG